MKLDRNDGRGKYAVINLRKLAAHDGLKVEGEAPVPSAQAVKDAIWILEAAGLIEYGAPGTEHEFFVLKLKDQFAGGPLALYAQYAAPHDKEYAGEVMKLAHRAGANSPWCKRPD